MASAAKEIVTALAPGFAQQFLTGIEYSRFKEFLQQTHPGDLNHDLDRLISDALRRAVGYIRQLYLDQVYKQAALTTWQKHVTNPFSDIKTMLENIERDLTAMLDYKDNTLKKINLADYLLDQADDCFDQITNYLFAVSGIDEHEPKWNQLRDFFRERLPVLFDLSYKEALKDEANAPAFKAFQIWLLEEGFRQNQQLLAGQEQILAELKALKAGQTIPEEHQIRQRFDQQTADTKGWLINEFTKFHEKLAAIYGVVSETSTDVKKIAVGQEKLQADVQIIRDKIDGSIPQNLTDNPFSANYFVGREDDLKAITQHVAADNLLLLMNGEGGIGKTTLAAQYYWKHQPTYAHTAWVFAEGGIRAALLANLSKPLRLTPGEQETEQQRFGTLIDAMAGLKKPALLVLDNANDATDLDETLYELKGSGFHVLITTRVNPFDDWTFLKIDTLPEEKALLLFCHHANPKPEQKDDDQLKSLFSAPEQQTLRAVLEGIGYNTLVLTLLAKNFRERNNLLARYRLADLLHELQTQGLLKLPKTKRVSSEYGHRYGLAKAEPEAIIAVMYDLKPLSSGELHCLSNLSVLPPEQIAYAQLVDLLGIDDEESFGELVMGMYRKGWIDVDESGDSPTVKISPVVQAVVLAKNAERLFADCQTLTTSLTTKFETLNHTQAYPYAELTRYLLTTLTVEVFQIAYLSSTLADFYKETGDLDAALLLIEKAADLYSKLGYQENYSICLGYLGDIHQALGKFGDALGYFEKVATLFEQLYKNDSHSESLKKGLAISYSKLGDIHQALGKFEDALSYFEKEVALFEQLYESNSHSESLKNGMAISYERLGEIHQELGKFEDALSYFEKRRKLTEELYQSNPRSENLKNGLAISYSKLGTIYRVLGKFGDALNYSEKVATLYEQLYESNPRSENLKNGLAISYEKLGIIHQALGKFEDALSYFEKRRKLGEELYQSNPRSENLKNGLAISYSKLGEIHQALGKFEDALSCFEKRRKLTEELYQSNPRSESLKNGLAISYSKLGDIHQALGKFGDALGYFEKVATLFKELHQSNPRSINLYKGLVISYIKLGVLYRETGNKEEARSYFQLAEPIWATLAQAAPQVVEFQNSLRWVRDQLANL